MSHKNFSRIFAAAVAILCWQCLTVAFAEDNALSISCEKMGGTVNFNVQLAGSDLIFKVTYPKSIPSYLGSSSGSGKNYGAGIVIYLDTDANPKTGMKGDPTFEPGAGGSEYSIKAEEMETSVAKDAKGNWINKPKLFCSLDKQGESVDLPENAILEWQFEVNGKSQAVDWVKPANSKIMSLSVPLSVLGLKPGAKIRVSAVVPLCNAAFPFPGVKDSIIVLK